MTKRRTKGQAAVRQVASAPFHYTASGLPNVWLLNGFSLEQTPYGSGVRIEDADGLHEALARSIVTGKRAFSGAELRFLRKHMELSQAGLARLLGCTDQTIARWEKQATGIDPSAERLIRLVVLDVLGDDPEVKAALADLAELDEALHGDRKLQRQGKVWREAA